MNRVGQRYLTRRDTAKFCAGASAGFLLPGRAVRAEAARAGAAPAWRGPLITRSIPSTGERLPAIGLGTSATRRPTECWSHPELIANCTSVVDALVANGGKVVDTAPTYKIAETMVGQIIANESKLRSEIFLADKLELDDFYKGKAGLDGFKASLQVLHTDKLDLLDVHSPTDPKTLDLAAMREWKAEGLCRYIGISRTASAGPRAQVPEHFNVISPEILKREKADFVEMDYAIDDVGLVNEDVLAATADVGVGVLVALPFGRGELFRKVLTKPMPDFAAEFDCTSWAQFFLKWILGNTRVTAAIPGTNNASHVIDNMGAAYGRLPDAKMRVRMKEYVQSL